MKQFKLWMLAAMMTCGLASVTMTSCTTDIDNPVVNPDVPEVKDYVERMVPVVDPHNKPQGVVTLRFYNDMPNVAYISISNFQSMIYPGTTVQVMKTAEGQYDLTSPCGTARVDTHKDTFESDHYDEFTNMMWMVQPGMANEIYDALPIIRWKYREAVPQTAHVTLDYGRFGIDLRDDDTNVYFPFATIADLYIDGYMHLADYNGEQVMVTPEGAISMDSGYPQFFITPILKETRAADMADFAYRNLCFTLTNLFGYPGRTLLENNGLKEKGLDQALLDYGQAGQMTRDLLLSTDMYDFITGTYTLTYLFDDGGHTYTDVTRISDIGGDPAFVEKLTEILVPKVTEFESLCPEYQPFKDFRQTRAKMGADVIEKRKEKFGEGVDYYKEGETVYCFFDSFLCDDFMWRDYYNGEGPKPTLEDNPNDDLLILLDALEKAEKDPEVKNFVLDIAANGGGSSDIVLFITSLFCNKSDMYYDNVLTGQRMKSHFEVDRNLDGKFDEKDAEVAYHLNFAVLISTYSFSCGNMLPAMVKDYGIPLLGQRSGGGSCAVLYNPSADGFGYRYSTHRNRLTNTKNENIDSGIEPTYVLETVDDFYDVPKVTKLIESYYSK